MKIKDPNDMQKWRGDIATKMRTCIKCREKLAIWKHSSGSLFCSFMEGETGQPTHGNLKKKKQKQKAGAESTVSASNPSTAEVID